MPLDLNAIADDVVALVSSALGPVKADMLAVKAQIAVLETRWNDVTAIRERLAVLEARPVPDATGLQERVAAAELRLESQASAAAALADLRNETGAVRERLAVLEARPLPDSTDALQERLAAAEFRLDAGPLLESTVNVLKAENNSLRERIAVLETRGAMPGPPGPAGRDGRDGAPGVNGANGVDGLGFDDLAVNFDGDRTLSLSFVKGFQRKDFPVALPFLRYQDVYQEGKAYTAGDVVTWAGSTWHCNEPTTTKPGEHAGAKAWTLCVKKGRDGKDGRDGDPGLPVVKVR